MEMRLVWRDNRRSSNGTDRNEKLKKRREEVAVTFVLFLVLVFGRLGQRLVDVGRGAAGRVVGGVRGEGAGGGRAGRVGRVEAGEGLAGALVADGRRRRHLLYQVAHSGHWLERSAC